LNIWVFGINVLNLMNICISPLKLCIKIDSQFSKAFRIKKGVRQGCPLSPILFNLFINDIFRDCNKYGVSIGSSLCCGGLFVDDIIICHPTREA